MWVGSSCDNVTFSLTYIHTFKSGFPKCSKYLVTNIAWTFAKIDIIRSNALPYRRTRLPENVRLSGFLKLIREKAKTRKQTKNRRKINKIEHSKTSF